MVYMIDAKRTRKIPMLIFAKQPAPQQETIKSTKSEKEPISLPMPRTTNASVEGRAFVASYPIVVATAPAKETM